MLPNLPFIKKPVLKKDEGKEYFLAILVRDENVTAVAFDDENGTLTPLSEHRQEFHGSVEDATEEELLNAFDRVVSMVESKLPTPGTLKKTLFCVKDSWITDGKITPEYRQKLKKICDELDLSPMGFVVFSEAIANYLEKKEGAPLSAVIVEVGVERIVATLLRAGKTIDVKSGPLTEALSHSIDLVLRHFDVELLPPRILVLGKKVETKEAEKELAQYDWMKSLPFRSAPQVEVLEKGFDVAAVLYSAATQMGLSFDASDAEVANEPEKKEPEQFEDIDEDTPKTPVSDLESFGFVLDGEVGDKEELAESKAEKKHHEPLHAVPDNYDPTPLIAAEEQETISRTENMGLPSNAALIGGKVRNFITSIPALFKKGTAGVPMKNQLLIGLGGLALLIVAFFAFYFFAVKTNVVIFISPKQIQKDQVVTFSTADSTDFGNNTIKAQTITTDEQGSVSTPATGKKEVGDKAKGTVTLYNNSFESKSISSGTTITSQNGITFTLDKDVTVASASGDIFSGTKPGTQDVSVTATDIGTESNLLSGTKFSIDGASGIAAKNSSAFSGGTKKQVTVVSDSDIKKLESDLPKTLQQKAQQDVQQKLGQDTKLLSSNASSKITKQSIDHKSGDQADKVTITGTVTFSELAYSTKDTIDFAKQMLESQIESNETLVNNGVTADMGNVSETDNGAKATIHAQAKIVPKIDTTQVAETIKGKSFADAANTIKSFPQVTDVTITFSPNLPLFPKIISHDSKQITVTIKNNE